jgi:hypothetical protein
MYSLGSIQIVKDPQGIKQFQWTEAGSNNPFQNIMVFPGDCKFEKVKQSNDRVYMLEFHQSKSRHFYWMQEKETENDEENCKKLNNILNGSENDQNMETSQTPVSNSGPQTRVPQTSQPPNPGAAGGPNQDYSAMISQFMNQENMKKMVDQYQQQKSGPSLNSVVTGEAKNKILEEEKACERLYQHCPEGQQNNDGLRDNVHSPQIRHVFSSLQNAIENGQGHILLTQMGIDPNNPGEYSEIVELFNNIAKGGS